MAPEQVPPAPWSLADELQADNQCANILREFHTHLLEQKTSPLKAGSLAQGADYFLRDYIISACRCSIFTPPQECVKQFAGHWYIVNTLEPAMKEIEPMLQGIAAFYQFLAANSQVDLELVAQIRKDCSSTEWFAQRLEAFWAIEGDGYLHWRAECPLPETTS
ncbi:MAG: hypothetical protein RBR43_02655 [Desulfuromonadaceae bacterium]|nr:hypothetical protein [Desulfuromonadaceae bacterium]